MIDTAAIAELRAEIGEDDFAEVVAAFLEETDEVMVRLSRGPDQGSMGEDFHFLKGSALNLGLSAFAEFCRTSEELARRDRATEIDMQYALDLYESSKKNFLSTIC